MSMQARTALAAAFFTTVFLPVLPPSSASAAVTCLTAPNKPAPQGSHWYYRLERPSQRKCWRLVQKDRKEQRAEQQVTPPQGDDDPEETTAAPPDRPAATHRPAASDARPAPEPVIRTLVTRPASSTSETTQPPPVPLAGPAPNPANASATPDASTAMPPVPANSVLQAPQRLDQPLPRPAVAADKAVQAGDHRMSGIGTLLAAIALLGLLGGTTCGILWIMRRRTDVLSAASDGSGDAPGDDSSFDHRPPVASAASEPPTFAPLPPMTLATRQDDVDEALRRFTENMRRRAA
jgi:hypothetical protein